VRRLAPGSPYRGRRRDKTVRLAAPPIGQNTASLPMTVQGKGKALSNRLFSLPVNVPFRWFAVNRRNVTVLNSRHDQRCICPQSLTHLAPERSQTPDTHGWTSGGERVRG